MTTDPGPVVVKVGGSLLDWPELPSRLAGWIHQLNCPRVLVVPGGGALADVVRNYDRTFGLGEEASHWLALETLSLNARLLTHLLAAMRPVLATEAGQARAAWELGRLPVLDSLAWARNDDDRPDRLPHRWEVTSDSVAARVAGQLGARRLVLLKSASPGPGTPVTDAARAGYVDPNFPEAVAQARAPGFEVHWVNLREWQPGDPASNVLPIDEPGGRPGRQSGDPPG